MIVSLLMLKNLPLFRTGIGPVIAFAISGFFPPLFLRKVLLVCGIDTASQLLYNGEFLYSTQLLFALSLIAPAQHHYSLLAVEL